MAEHIPTEGASGNDLMKALESIKVPEVPTSGKGGGGGGTKMIKNPVDGSTVSRTDYMRALAKAGWQRPQILAHVVEITGDKTLRYQTVHQATKDFYPKRAGSTSNATANQGEDGGDEGEYDNE